MNHEVNKDKETDPDDFLVNWGESASPEEFAGDSMTDDLLPSNDTEDNLDFRASLPLGYPFLHPMHDASLDVYENPENTEE